MSSLPSVDAHPRPQSPGFSARRKTQTSRAALPPSPPQSPRTPQEEARPTTPSNRLGAAAALVDIIRCARAGGAAKAEDKHEAEGEGQGGKEDGGRSWTNYTLSPSEHQRFLNLLLLTQTPADESQSLVSWYRHTHRLRHDWDPASSSYAVRMPTNLHEFFTRAFMAELLHAIRLVGTKSQELGAITANMYEGGSGDITLDPPSDSSQDASSPTTRSPDGSIRYTRHLYPASVFELSFSQKRKDLAYLADSYIVDSQHGIRSVIAVDIEYQSPRAFASPAASTVNKLATVSYWTPWTTTDPHDGSPVGASQALLNEVPFRSAQGQALPGALNIPLVHLVPSEIASSHPVLDKEAVVITYDRLAELLKGAEEQYRMVLALRKKAVSARNNRKRGAATGDIGADVDQENTTELTHKKPRKWRRVKRSPPEEMSSGTEAKFASSERKADEKGDSADHDFMLERASAAPITTVPRRSSRRGMRGSTS